MSGRTTTILDREQSRRVDQIAIEQFDMSGLVLMENAGRGCVDVLLQLGVSGSVVICCGKGNNAGDGFVMARHLALRDVSTRVLLFCDPQELSGDAEINYRILTRMSLPIEVIRSSPNASHWHDDLTNASWIVDALLGTGARGAPRPPLPDVIARLNTCPARKLAIDIPSGLDCNTGRPADNTFQADHTCTLVGLKPGFSSPSARQYVGEIHVIDIGMPHEVIDLAKSATATGE